MTIVVLAALAGTLGLLHDMTKSANQSCGTDIPIKNTGKQTKGKIKMSNATAVSSETFEQEVLQSDEPVLVDFWAPWCMPCRMLGPTVDELAGEYTGKAKVVKVNTDDNQDLANKYGIRGIPTLMLFKNGEPVDRMVGVQSKSVLSDKLEKAIGR